MRNQDVIEKIVPPIHQVETPSCKGPIPMRVRGRVVTTKVVGVTFEGRQEVVAWA